MWRGDEWRDLYNPLRLLHSMWKINFLFVLLSPASSHTQQPSVTPHFHKFQIWKPMPFRTPFIPAMCFCSVLIPSIFFPTISLTPQLTDLAKFSHRSTYPQSQFALEANADSLLMNLTPGTHPVNVYGWVAEPSSPPPSKSHSRLQGIDSASPRLGDLP